MTKRLIDTTATELSSYSKSDLLTSIADSEGRTLAAETIGTVTPMLVNITNAEFVTSLGADLIMLNIFDVDQPVIQGLPHVSPEDTIREVKRLTGRMVAINLEPATIKNNNEESVWNLTTGRQATVDNARKAADMGVDMIVLTGNPGVGVDNEAIMQALSKLKDAVGDRVILTAGKMHASGIISEAGEKILTEKDIVDFIDAGADVILLPAPGTVPGITMEYAGKLIKKAHEKGALAMTTIGTSQKVQMKIPFVRLLLCVRWPVRIFIILETADIWAWHYLRISQPIAWQFVENAIHTEEWQCPFFANGE